MKIRIVIEKGQVTHDVTETSGSGCRDLTKPYVDALGIPQSEVAEEIKPEMYAQTELDQSL